MHGRGRPTSSGTTRRSRKLERVIEVDFVIDMLRKRGIAAERGEDDGIGQRAYAVFHLVNAQASEDELYNRHESDHPEEFADVSARVVRILKQAYVLFERSRAYIEDAPHRYITFRKLCKLVRRSGESLEKIVFRH